MKRIASAIVNSSVSVALAALAFGVSGYEHDLDEKVWEPRAYEASEVRLIGECNGKFYVAMEEDMFPPRNVDGSPACKWIVGIDEFLDSMD